MHHATTKEQNKSTKRAREKFLSIVIRLHGIDGKLSFALKLPAGFFFFFFFFLGGGGGGVSWILFIWKKVGRRAILARPRAIFTKHYLKKTANNNDDHLPWAKIRAVCLQGETLGSTPKGVLTFKACYPLPSPLI